MAGPFYHFLLAVALTMRTWFSIIWYDMVAIKEHKIQNILWMYVNISVCTKDTIDLFIHVPTKSVQAAQILCMNSVMPTSL